MKKIVLVTAVWCTSCIIMRPRYLEVIKNSNTVKEFNEYDFDDDEEVGFKAIETSLKNIMLKLKSVGD